MQSHIKTGRKNKVFEGDYRPSRNFFYSDVILRNYLENQLPKEALAHMKAKWIALGKDAAQHMDALSLVADKKAPELRKRNWQGEHIDEIDFHPAYWELMKIAVDSGIFRVKWHPELRKQFAGSLHSLGFGSGYLYAMSESGIYCPLCMTDGVALLIDSYCNAEDKERLLPGIYTDNAQDLLSGAMFLTEKTGGSDVGANLVTATSQDDGTFNLNGEKWFCSNANADLIFVLARTDPSRMGTAGLSIFLVEKYLPDGSRNPMEVIRLKDKLGVRSMASAEIMLTDTIGKLVGEEFKGFRVMADMINLSRLYNSVAALAAGRRALAEAYTFVKHRTTFGKTAIGHALVRDKLQELGSLHVMNFYLCWRAIRAMDLAEKGDVREAALLRLLTPMVKKWSAETAVYLVRESMELMGGLGYIEDTVMPKLMRDVLVLPIWEGAGNIMILDMLRASVKSDGLHVMIDEIYIQAQAHPAHGREMKQELDALSAAFKEMEEMERDEMELKGKQLFERLTRLYQQALLLSNLNNQSASWLEPALKWIGNTGKAPEVISVEKVESLIGWQV